MPTLGRLERVQLRDFWSHEAVDFTPWLAQEENLKLLEEIIGLELVVEAQEQSVGPFRADILCKDTDTDRWVLIENQIERTDHKHLGQLLTYAAGLKAATIVWIAEKFTEEHRAALDWLNQITDDGFHFFGLEIELWRIGDSLMAPKLSLVSGPNDWTKTVSEAARNIQDGALSETRQTQNRYWIAFREYLLAKSQIVKPTKASTRHWMNFSIGHTAFKLNTFANLRDKRIGVSLVLVGPNKDVHYRMLHQDKVNIEKEVGASLFWQAERGEKSSQILWRNMNVDPAQQQDWPIQHEWLQKALEIFYRVFTPYIKQMNAVELSSEESNDIELPDQE